MGLILMLVELSLILELRFCLGGLTLPDRVRLKVMVMMKVWLWIMVVC